MSSATLSFDAEQFLKTLSNGPGVYRMLDAADSVLYVGKARNLKRRVASYFRPRHALEGKTRALMSHTQRVEATVTHTETEALLLENNLIKEHRPRYNILLRDDKSFPYIHLTTEQEFPRLAFYRGARRGAGRYFGPYSSAGAVRETLSLLQKLFRIRQCSDTFFRNRSRPCLQYQINRCTAPCVGLVDAEDYGEDVRHAIMFLEGKSEEMIDELVGRMERASKELEFEQAARYRDQIVKVRRVQERQYISGARGNIDVIAARQRGGIAVVQVFDIRDGQNLANKTFFPDHAGGATVAEVLDAFLPQYYLSAPNELVIPAEIIINGELDDAGTLSEVLGERAGRRVTISQRVRGDRARSLEMAVNNAELALTERLANRASLQQRFEALQTALGLDEVPERIECFDISHTRGEATVASCVVFGGLGAVKSDYRRFNIKDVAPGDDYAAIRQALERRYTRVKKEDGKLPDLVLVDGGKGQLTQAVEVLAELQLDDISIAAVAKGPSRKAGMEQLFLPHSSRPLILPPDSAALHLVQQIRDEAHRFAIVGHRARRSRSRNTSILEEIPGIGPKLRQRLLVEFGGLPGITRAGVEDLCRVKGISRTLGQAIYEKFRDP